MDKIQYKCKIIDKNPKECFVPIALWIQKLYPSLTQKGFHELCSGFVGSDPFPGCEPLL